MACGERMAFAELQESGDELIVGGADVYYTFCCPRCDEEVSISQRNQLPHEAIHETCGTKVDPRAVGGFWSVVKADQPPGPIN